MPDRAPAGTLPLYLDPSVKLAVEGLDLEQSMSAILLNDETAPILYGPDFSPTCLRYRSGARPQLEQIAATLAGETPRARVAAALEWVIAHVLHPYFAGNTAKNRAISEEAIIASGRGWCNEQARTLIALCEVMEIPGRMCFLSHENGLCGHATTEIYVDGKWAWHDPTFGVRVELPDGSPGTAAELSGPYRSLAHQVFRPVLEACEPNYLPYVEGETGWRKSERLTPDAGGDLLHTIGICNYLIDGVDAV